MGQSDGGSGASTRLKVVVAVLVGLVVGYFAGREHLKYEMRTALSDAFSGVSESIKKSMDAPTTADARPSPPPAAASTDTEPVRVPTPEPPPKPKPPAVKSGLGKVDARLVSKEYVPTNLEIRPPRFQERIDFEFEFQSRLPKPLRAFTGTIVFQDLFDRTIMRVGITVEDPVPANGTVSWSGGIDYNQFMDTHRTLRGKSAEDLKVVFETKSVIYADGARENFETE